MSGIFSPSTPKANKPTPVNGLQVQTSSYGLPVALRYGRNRGAGQLIDYVGFKSVEHAQKQKTGGKGGSKSTTSYSYTYNVTPLFALGEGQLQAINRVWKDNTVQTLAQSGFTFFNGSWTQTAWSYLTSNFPTHARNYIGTAYVGGANLDLGDSPSLPNYNFDISGLLYIAGKPGAKPGAIVSDYLTHAQHGAGFNYVMNFAGSAFENYCLARGIYLSPFEEQQRTASSFISDIADACNSAIVWSQSQLMLIPYGDEAIVGTDGTYTPDTTPLYDITEDDYYRNSSDGNVAGYVQIDPKPLEQCYNHIQLEIVDADNDFVTVVVEAMDQADIDTRGHRPQSVIQRHDITDVDLGRDIAQMMLQRSLYIVNTYTFPLTIRHSLLDLMDYVTINDAVNGIVTRLVRIIGVEEQDDYLLITAEDALANATHAPRYSTQKGSGYLPDLGADPGNPTHVQLINAPTLLCPTGYELWLAASSNSADWGGAQVWVSYDNVNYELAGTLTGPSRMGVLTSSMASYGGTAGSVDGVALCNVTIDRGFIFAGTADTRDEFTTMCYVADNGGEFFSYRDAALTGTLSYQIGNLCRGGYGTHANSHAAGATFVRCDDCMFRIPYDRNMVNKTVYVKLLSYNTFGGAIQALSDVTAHSIVLKPNTGNGPVRGGDPLFDSLSTADAARLQALEDMGDDSKLSANEKITTKKTYDSLVAEVSGLSSQADQYFITTEKTNYTSALTALQTYLRTVVGVLNGSNVWTNTTGTTAITRATWNTNWENLYGTRQALKNAIYAAANKFTYGVNLLRNPTGSAGFFGWDGGWIGGSQQSMTTRMESVGPCFACNLTGTSADQGISQYVNGSLSGQVMSLSCLMYNGHMTSGSMNVSVRFYNSSGAEIDSSNRPAVSANTADAWGYYSTTFTAPSGAVSASVSMRCTGTGGGLSRFSQLKIELGPKPTPFDASTNVADQLGVAGSGVRIGDARNLRAIIYANYASGWSGLSFSTSTTTTNCAISISAATLRAGSVAVAYNSSSINVAGSAGTTKTVYLYYDDDNLDGGTKTPAATTSLITALSGDGRVLLGSITITYPTSGTSTGGGGGPCPDENAWVLLADPEGVMADLPVRAKEVCVGHYLRLTDGRAGLVTYSERREAHRVKVSDAYGRTFTCSDVAPLELFRGRGMCVRAFESMGKWLRARFKGWEGAARIDRVTDEGMGYVQHITCENACFWAGDLPDSMYGHHNLKPLNP